MSATATKHVVKCTMLLRR